MIRLRSFAVCICLFLTFSLATAEVVAAASAGGKCIKAGATTGTAKKQLTCKKVGKKLVWTTASKSPNSLTVGTKVPGHLANPVQISFNRSSGLFFGWSLPINFGSGPLISYRIEFRTLDTPWLFLQDALPTQRSITAKHNELVGTTIRFRVAGVNKYGVGTFSTSEWVQYASTTGSDIPATSQLPIASATTTTPIVVTTTTTITTTTTVLVGTVSQRNAVNKGASYLKFSAFSRTGLIGQLEYEGFSLDDATYGTDAQNADWNAQAVKKGASYLKFSAFSRTGLIGQLEYEGFTTEQATFGTDAQNADWNVQAGKKAASYLKYSAFSRSGLIDQLLYEGYTQAQAEYGVGTTGL